MAITVAQSIQMVVAMMIRTRSSGTTASMRTIPGEFAKPIARRRPAGVASVSGSGRNFVPMNQHR